MGGETQVLNLLCPSRSHALGSCRCPRVPGLQGRGGEGGPGAYGLYVKTVNGIKADYDKDKAYWAFYVNDSYAMSGVDSTEIKEGEVYSFKVEKA